ncbi:MAG TPA: PIN domain-containing protein [Nitrolancea sp.]|nr:PIN domain-containing protein [Nitrolancea sp.]
MSRASSRDLVCVDTSAYFSVANIRDVNHHAARSILVDLVANRRRFVTTNFILAELHALLLTRINRSVAIQVLHEIDASQDTTVERVSEEDEQRAREIIVHYVDKNFSLTDATCFAVMERLGIAEAFSFDRNFAQYGWTLIQPPR